MQQLFRLLIFFKSALHVSGDKFANPQEHFLIVYTYFGTMHRHCCWPVPRLRQNSVTSQLWHSSVAVSVHCTKSCTHMVPSQRWHWSAAVLVHCTKSCIYSQKVHLRMGEFVARHM